MNTHGRRFFTAALASLFVVLLFSGFAFAKDLDEIKQAIIEKGAQWTAGETSVSRLSAEEKKMRVKLFKPSRDEGSMIPVYAIPASTAPSGSFDWRNTPDARNFVTGVRDQGNCGSCWAFATTGALESYGLIANNLPAQENNLSEQVLVSCGGAGSCSGGYVDRASNYIRDTGLPGEICYPYIASNGNCANACSSAKTATESIGYWQYVATTAPTVEKIKDALYSYGPLATTMDVYTDFYYYTDGVYEYTSGNLEGGHAILIVGYDDATSSFIVKNSWGSNWGLGGYFKIGYSQLTMPVEFGYYTIVYRQPPANCSYALSPTAKSFNSKGGKATLSVTTSLGCKWTAVSDRLWIKITSGAKGNGSGTVYYSVSANTTKAVRSGTIDVNGQLLRITQAAGR